MKYLRIFEDWVNKPTYNIGDYVICAENIYPEIIDYIGLIVDYDGYNFYVRYDYDKLPDRIKPGFKTYGDLGIRPFPAREIVRKAEQWELDQNKYNL